MTCIEYKALLKMLHKRIGAKASARIKNIPSIIMSKCTSLPI